MALSRPLREILAPALQSGVDLPALFHLIQDGLPAALGLQAGRLWVRHPQGRAWIGPRDVGLDPSDGFPEELAREGMALEAPLWVPSRTPASPLGSLFTPDVRAWLVVPLRLEGEDLGLLALLSRKDVDVPGDPPALARELEALLAPSIRRAQAQAAVLDDLKLHHLLLELVRRLSGAFSLGDLLQTLFRSLERLVPVDALFVAVKKPDGRYEALMETDLDERDRRMYFPTPRPIDPDTSKILETIDAHDYLLILRTREELQQVQKEPGLHAIGNTARRSASLLYLPIWVGDVFSGILSVQSYRHDAYRHADARRLLQIADYIGLAIRLAGSP